jgi:hypothetical protein
MSGLLDEFGRPIQPEYIDENALSFALCIPGLPKEIRESLERSQRYYEMFDSPLIYDADGRRVNLSKPMQISGKPFRVPFSGC